MLFVGVGEEGDELFDIIGSIGVIGTFCSPSTHFQRPYVLPTVVCHNLRVPSSDPDAYNSPSGEKRTQWTGPKCPLKDSKKKKKKYINCSFYIYIYY